MSSVFSPRNEVRYVCMVKFGRLKTVEERKITGSYGRRRAVNPVLINVWELETSEGFPTTAHLSNISVWFTYSLEESFARSVLYGKQCTEELYCFLKLFYYAEQVQVAF